MNIADDLVRAYNDGYQQGLSDAVKTGEWEERIVEDPQFDPYGFFKRRWYCSRCGRYQTYGKTEYCCHCGAAMKKGEEDADSK